MVRINLIPCKYLTDQHLLAENLEILYLKSNIPKFKKEIPGSYCLGKGHQKFFINKIGYLTYRQYEIKRELIKRGFKCSIDLPIIFKTNWLPSEEDFKIIIPRLLEKVKIKPHFYKYHSRIINIIGYTKLLNSLKTEKYIKVFDLK